MTTPVDQKPAQGKQKHVRVIAAARGHVEGFGGRLSAENNAIDFQRAALQLLHLNLRIPWTFNVQIRGSSFSDGTRTIAVNKRDFPKKFETEVLSYLQGEWTAFVSRSAWHGMHEPRIAQKDVVRIRLKDNTAYWKIPDYSKTDYGINQLQDNFFRALSVLFPPDQPRLPQAIQIGIGNSKKLVNIGFGGMDAPNELWRKVSKYLICSKVPLDCDVSFSGPSHVIGVRMVGSRHFGTAKPGNYADIYNSIVRLSREYANPGQPPKFRIWKSGRAREDGGNSEEIEYKPAEAAGHKIKKFLMEESGDTNCVWFRPEWPSITIKDITTKKDPSSTTSWNIVNEGGSLAAFKSKLQELFHEPDPQKIRNIEITDSNAYHRFVLAGDMTEEHWRRHIYDWFSGDRIDV